MPRKEKYLTKDEVEYTKKISMLEGSSTSVTTGFGDQYIIPFAVKLGASSGEIAFLSSFPTFFGSLSQIIGSKLTEIKKDRKKIVSMFVTLQAFTLLPLFVVPFLIDSIFALTFIFSLYLVLGNLASPSWNSWMGDLIPEGERANYFSRRNKKTTLALMLSVIAAGLILNYFESINIWWGFAVLFTIALITRAYAAFLFTKHYEPAFIVEESEKISFTKFMTHMTENNFGNFVIFRSLMSIAVMISAPFFAVYMLKNLGFTYIQFSVVVLVPMLIKFLTVMYWAKYADRFGNKSIIFISGILISLIPLSWFIVGMFLSGSEAVFYFIILAEALSGFAWAGFELATFNYMLENTKSGNRARLHSYFTLFFGTAVLIGGLAGAGLTKVFSTTNGQGLLWIFLVSFVLRFLVSVLFSSRLKESRVHYKVREGRLFYEVVIHRPLGFTINTTMTGIALLENKLEKASKPLVKFFRDPLVMLGLEEPKPKVLPMKKRVDAQKTHKNQNNISKKNKKRK